MLTSNDNGRSWQRCVDLEDDHVKVGNADQPGCGEFSYPSIINDGQDVVGVYTIHRQQIGFWRAPADWLVAQTQGSK